MTEVMEIVPQESDNKTNVEQKKNLKNTLFVGGLTKDITVDDLTKYFERYGALESCEIPTHPKTKKPRLFAFVEFQNDGCVDKVQYSRPHVVNNQVVDTKRKLPARFYDSEKQNVRTLYVGGLNSDVDESAVRKHFEQYGPVLKVAIRENKDSSKPRFAHVDFIEADVVDKVLQEEEPTLDGERITVDKAHLPPNRRPTRGVFNKTPLPGLLQAIGQVMQLSAGGNSKAGLLGPKRGRNKDRTRKSITK